MASYYLYLNDQQVGPYSEDQIRQMLSGGQVTEDQYAWREGDPEWVPLKNYNLCARAPKLKLQPRTVDPAAPNPLVEAEEARVQKEEQKFQRMEQAAAIYRATAPLGFMDRIYNAWSLMGASFRVLWADKTLLMLPLLSTASAIAVLIVFAVPTSLFYVANPELLSSKNLNHPIHYIILFLFYLVNYFVIIFFNSALISCAASRMLGQECTAKDGIRFALTRLPSILGWAVLSATIGVLLDIIDQAIRQRSEFLANLVRTVLGFAWTLIAYLALPALVIEKIGPIKALKTSVELLKRTWGEQLTGNVGFGAIFGLLMLPGIVFVFIAIWLGASAHSVGLFAVLITLAVLYFIVMALAQSAVRVVYQAALYLYARDRIAPAGFSAEALASSFASKA